MLLAFHAVLAGVDCVVLPDAGRAVIDLQGAAGTRGATARGVLDAVADHAEVRLQHTSWGKLRLQCNKQPG